MKRLLGVFMIVCILFSLSGCGKKTSAIDSQSNKIPQVDQNNNPEKSISDQKVSKATSVSQEKVKKIEFEEIVPEVPTVNGYIFSNGMGSFNYNGKYGYIGEDGKVKIEPKYHYGMTFNENYAIVDKADDRALFIIDKQGNEIPLSTDYEFNYDYGLNKFVDGVAFIRVPMRKTANNKGALAAIDTTGKEIFRIEGLVRFAGMVKGNYMFNGLIYDKSWKKISEFPFPNFNEFGYKLVNYQDGLICARKEVNGSLLYGIIDTEGKTVIDFKFEELKVPSDGMIAFKKYGKWGFIDYTGKVVIEPTYDEAYAFSNGLCQVKIANKFGFIDSQNKMVIAPTYNDILSKTDDYFKFNDDGIALVSITPVILIDKTGQAITLNGGLLTFNWKESILSLVNSDKKTRVYKLKK